MHVTFEFPMNDKREREEWQIKHVSYQQPERVGEGEGK
jgi:hypothetical protein